MKNLKSGIAALTAVTVIGLSNVANSPAAPTPELLQNKPDKTAPFKGKVEALDAAAKTITVDNTIIVVTDSTKLMKEGKTITLADIKVGDLVHGRTRQNADGKSEAVSVTIGTHIKE